MHSSSLLRNGQTMGPKHAFRHGVGIDFYSGTSTFGEVYAKYGMYFERLFLLYVK